MKARVQQSSDASFEEAVTVNQRGLIDKILARYSTELTLFRELLQNSNDAKATELQIRFSGTGYWDDEPNPDAPGARQDASPSSQQHQQQGSSKASPRPRRARREGEELSFTGLRLCNNGMVFRSEDWNRIKSIADGNPDETKVGFFGVGFYSVFSLSDEPTVLSGSKALSFHWKKDALFVTHGSPPEAQAEDSEEDKRMLEMVRNEGWTVFDLPVRDDPPRPKLPLPKEMADFLVRCLTFTTTLELVEVYYDGRLALSVGRQSSSDVAPVSVSKLAHMPQGSMFRFQNARTEPLRYAIQHHDRPTPVIVEMMRVLSTFSVHVDDKFRAAMYRVTKKNPPRQVGVQLIFDAGKALQVSATAASWKDLESFSPASASGGRFFIGSGVTQQSTGSKCHCNAPFMPTMERNSMDLSDITLATWNRALLWATGFLQRLTFEHLCNEAVASRAAPDDARARAAGPDAPPTLSRADGADSSPAQSGRSRGHEKLEALFRAHDAAQTGHAPAASEGDAKRAASTSTAASGEDLDAAQKKRIQVLSAMATFAMKETTPVQQVGGIVLAGFYNAMSEAPSVWTTTGLRSATHARIKDRTGLHEIVHKAASIVDIPSDATSRGGNDQGSSSSSSSVADALAKQAKSALGFFSSFMGADSGSSGGASRKPEAPTKESLATLCERFIQELQHRRLLRELDVRDLAAELRARTLKDSAEVVKLLRWLLARERTLRQLREEAAADRVTCFCDWCGNRMVVAVEVLKRELAKHQEASQSQGFLSRLTSTFAGNAGEELRVSLECSRCQQISLVSPIEVLGSLSQVQSASSISNKNLLALARLEDGRSLSAFSHFLSSTLLKRVKASSNKGMPERLESAFWAHPRTSRNMLPMAISQEFKDSDLSSGVLAHWLKPLPWKDWAMACVDAARAAPRVPDASLSDDAAVKPDGAAAAQNAVSLENLAVVSNVLRVAAFALYYKEIEDTDKAYLLSALEGSACMPVRSRQLMRPSETYLGAEATGGFSALPVAAVCEALEDGTFVVNAAIPKDTAVVRLMKALQVKEHVDLAFVFEEFNKGSLGWNRQEILHYIASLRSKLDANEMKRLRRIHFLPKVEVRDDGTAHPSLQSFEASALHFASKDMAALEVPMVYAIVEQGLPYGFQPKKAEQSKDAVADAKSDARTFFDATADKVGNATQLLLKDLGVRTHPDLDVVLDRASSGRDQEARQAALWYLVRFFEQYRNTYSTRKRKAFIPCTGGQLYHPLRCFTDQRVALLASPCVDEKLLPKKYAQLLGVRDSPSSQEIMEALTRSPPVRKTASKVFEYVAGLLPNMERAHLQELSKREIVPLPVGDADDQNEGFRLAAPRSIYFRPRAHTKGKYEGLFSYVLYDSTAANMFLRAIGVRDEPTVNELAGLLSDSNEAARHLERVGTEGYLQVLRMLAVEWSSISSSTLTRMSRSKCLLGLRSVESKAPMASSNPSEEEILDSEMEDVTYHLEVPTRIYINDHAVMYRIFDPMVAPSEDIFEPLYQKLGSKTLSSAVAARTQSSPPYAVTAATRELEATIRRRVQLLFFKRRRSDFASNANKWLATISNQSKSFVFEVPQITRTLTLDGVQKRISCSAYAVNERTRMLLVTAKVSVAECASELCDVFLRKNTLNDKLLWSTILQSSDQQLRDQGFPVARKLNNPPRPAPAPAPAPASGASPGAGASTGASAAAPAPAGAPARAPATPPDAAKAADPPAGNTQPQPPHPAPKSSPSAKGATSDSPPNKGAPDAAVPPPAPQSSNSTMQRRRSFRERLASVMPKAGAATAASLAKSVSPAQRLPSTDPPPAAGPKGAGMQHQAQQQAQQQQQVPRLQKGSGGSNKVDPLVNREFRKQALQSGLNRCNTGGNAPVIQSAAGERVMAPLLDDLHEHNLVRVPIQFAGMDCYVEQGGGDPQIYEKRSVEATAFAQLLLGIARNVFNLRSASVCHLYYHFEGQTAAFNRGGALYFNFYVFLSQLEVSQWDVHTLVGADMQPRFVLPPEAVIDWFGVFGHELAHNHKGDHDAEFSHWMMMYLTTYVEALSTHLDLVRSAISTQQVPAGLE